MLKRLFLDHPSDVGETYWEHMSVAARFGAMMLLGGAACVVHAFIPAFFVTTGSSMINRLHMIMVAKRAAKCAVNADARSIEWMI